MFLILDYEKTTFGRHLLAAARSMHLNTLYLTGKEIVHGLSIDYRLTDHDKRFTIRFGKQLIRSEDIYGVYCGLDYFTPMLWPCFSVKDADYAAQETYALWLALLTTLSCRMLNSPALDTLAGHMLSVPETLSMALKHGLNIPLSITLESGSAASTLLAAHGTLQFTNLGQISPQELVIQRTDAKSVTKIKNHCRVTEILAGNLVHIALVGERYFISGRDENKSPFPIDLRIPQKIKTGLYSMQNELDLNMAEYQFRITSNREWIFSGYSRVPTNAMVAFGDTLFNYIVNYAIGNAGS